ncbi:MAG TPA: tetratricopeptide repeat protein [Steroidobacteraceae bacterium]|nr:tetratricopeptide repeat protein [Steroidobacteraceae bacterium]
MQSYSVRDVERVLRLSRSTIQGLIKGGFVRPSRGPRRQYRFSFQDLIVLRTARALTQAKVPPRRIRRSLEDLRQHLPETAPLSGLSIRAIGDRVVVRDGKTHWQVDDGQYVLELDVSVAHGELRVVERHEPVAHTTKQPRDWFTEGLQLETVDPRAAQEAYQRAVDDDPHNTAAWINWGRLLHEQGGKSEAESVYQRALRTCGPDSLLMFNLGVVLEDLGRPGAALDAYQSALEEDPDLVDCHYNLARLYESLGKPQHAIRHLGQYRRLVMSVHG